MAAQPTGRLVAPVPRGPLVAYDAPSDVPWNDAILTQNGVATLPREAQGEALRIEELARTAGTTTRTIREHQTRGLLHPPRLVGRTGWYDESHLARLRVIASLQERGFSLAAIKELLDGWSQGADVERMLGFGEAMLARFTDERPQVMTRDQVMARVPQLADDAILRLALRAGVVAPHSEGYVVRSFRLLQIGAELAAAGIPVQAALETALSLRRRLHGVAEQFVELFDVNVWMPFARQGMPAERWAAVNDALVRLRPRAREVVDIILAQEMEAVVTAVGFENARRMGRRNAAPEETRPAAPRRRRQR
jgi:DNA-binding transcriptional MerR regulator